MLGVIAGEPLHTQVLTWVSFGGSVFAAAVNFRSGHHDHTRAVRVRMYLTGVLASVYAGAYLALMLGPFTRVEWSRVMSWLAPLPWFVVWPTWGLWRGRHRAATRPATADELVQIMGRALDEVAD